MSLKRTLLKGIDWFCTFVYLCQLSAQGLCNPFKKLREDKKRPIYVLANGPSMKILLEKIEKEPAKYQDYDFSVVNDFVNNPMFEKIKPTYITMSDPLFFIDSILSERGHKAMKVLSEKVDWDMIFFIPYRFRKSSYLEPVRRNPHIKIIAYHDPIYRGRWLTSFAIYLFKRGVGNGEFGTVVQNAIYAAMMMGYKELRVFGIDHNYFDTLAVNSQNIVCFKDKHFYEEESKWKPMICHQVGELYNKPYTMAGFLREQASVFKGHLIMEQLAKAIGVKIYNCTPNSMVDAYERKREE